MASLVGIWITGVLIDKWLRALTLASTVLFGLAVLALGAGGVSAAVIYSAAAIWGVGFGGVSTLFQTAIAKTAGPSADVAQSMLVTAWNIAIAGGGVIGGLLLDGPSIGAFPPVVVALLAATWLAAWSARKHGFPPHG